MNHSTNNDFAEPVSLLSLVAETVFACHFDRKLVAGDPPEPGSPLALHIARLTSTHQRDQIARLLERMIREAHTVSTHSHTSPCVPLDRERIMAAESRIEDVVVRLHAARPVSAHGVARLRLLLSNGVGPLYRHGRGDLAAELDSVLAAL